MTTETETHRLRHLLDAHRLPGAAPLAFVEGAGLEAACRPLFDLVDQLARQRTDSEIADGLSGDLAVELLGGFIEEARRYSIDRPAQVEQRKASPAEVGIPATAELPETTYGFDAGEREGPDCRTCNGTGEVIEFPPDDDERMVACTACGGTGEALQGPNSVSLATIDGIMP